MHPCLGDLCGGVLIGRRLLLRRSRRMIVGWWLAARLLPGAGGN